MTTETEMKVHTRPVHKELEKPEYAGVHWHHGGYHYRTSEAFPCIYFAKPEEGADPFAFVATEDFMAKLALMKEAEEKWLDYIERMMSAKMEVMIDEILEGKR